MLQGEISCMGEVQLGGIKNLALELLQGQLVDWLAFAKRYLF